MAYGVPVPVHTRVEDDFALRAADVEKAITPKTQGAHAELSHQSDRRHRAAWTSWRRSPRSASSTT